MEAHPRRYGRVSACLSYEEASVHRVRLHTRLFEDRKAYRADNASCFMERVFLGKWKNKILRIQNQWTCECLDVELIVVKNVLKYFIIMKYCWKLLNKNLLFQEYE